MKDTAVRVGGLGLAAGAVGWQAAEGMPTSDLQWAEFALRALLALVGVFMGSK